MNLGKFRLTNRVVFPTAGLFKALNMLIFTVNVKKEEQFVIILKNHFD